MKKILTFAEVNEFVEYVVNDCFYEDESGEITYLPIFKDKAILEKTLMVYFDDCIIRAELEEGYHDCLTFLSKHETEYNEVTSTIQYKHILSAIDERIKMKLDRIAELKANKTDILFIVEKVATVIETVNSKIAELNPKKLEKLIERLKPEDIIKAYNKVEGDKLRDEAIEKLATENKNLRNQINAINVVADKVISDKVVNIKK